VKGLQQIYDPTTPYATAGLDLGRADHETNELIKFCHKLQLLGSISYQAYSSKEEAVGSKVNEITSAFLPEEQLYEQFWIDWDLEQERLKKEEEERRIQEEIEKAEAERIAKEESEAAAAAAAALAANPPELVEEVAPVDVAAPPAASQAPAGSRPASALPEGQAAEGRAEEASAKVEIEKRLPIIEECVIPTKLAEILDTFWKKIEAQNSLNGKEFSVAIRDIKFQTLQRRRISIDTIYINMLRYDSRQELFNDFRGKFNAIDDELRYDPDCIAELYLRSTELRNEISKLCESRYDEVKSIIEKFKKDNNISILIYHLRCEGMYLFQNEINRFYALLDVLFDFTKSIQTYEIHEKIANELELLLPASDPTKPMDANAKGGKDKEKDKGKGKNTGGSTFTPYREPVAPFLVSSTNSLVQGIPLKEEEAPVDPKAKPKKVRVSASPLPLSVAIVSHLLSLPFVSIAVAVL
jgi:hypothetical protein